MNETHTFVLDPLRYRVVCIRPTAIHGDGLFDDYLVRQAFIFIFPLCFAISHLISSLSPTSNLSRSIFEKRREREIGTKIPIRV